MADSNPTTQLIDSKIVSLLGLQDDLELSHEDYFRSLREASIAARMSGSKFSSEDVSLITEELKRVRKEDKNIKFITEKKRVKTKTKAKTQKVPKKKSTTPPRTPKANTKVTSLSTFVQPPTKTRVTKEPKSLTGAPPEVSPKVPLLPAPKKKTVEVKEKKQKIKKENCCDVLGKKLTTIDSTLESILSTLKEQFALRKKDSERERRGREKSGREDEEKKLEKGSGIKEIVGLAKGLLSPFQDVFDRIKRFIVFTLLGKAFTMFMDWMKDPKNRQTFFTITKFLTDHWVLIVGSYLLFGTKLGGFVRSISKLVIKLAVRSVVATGRLIAVLAKSKWGRVALAAGAVAGGAVAVSQMGKKKDEGVEKYADGGIIGGIGNALKFSPLGMAFQAGKFGVKTLGKAASGVGKAASGAAGFVGKGLQKSLNVAALPLTIGFKGLSGASEFLLNGLKSLDIFKLLAGPIQSIQKKGGDKDPKLAAAGGIPGLIGLITKKTSESVGKTAKDSKKSKEEVKPKEGKGYAKGGLINPLSMGLMGAMIPGGGLLGTLMSPLMQSKQIGGEHGVPVSGAGKDDRLLKVRTGDAILTEKDQKLLSSGKILEKMSGPLGALGSLISGKGFGQETVVAAKKGEAVVTQEDQKNIFEKTGINIPAFLAGRKASKVSSDQLKTKSGNPLGGFFGGGIIPGFASGGIVGGDAAFVNQRYQELLKSTNKDKIQQYNSKHGEGAYEKNLLVRLNKAYAPEKSKLPPLKTTSKYDLENRNKAKKGGTETLSINGIRIPGGGQALKRLKNAKTSDLNVEGLVSGAKSKIKKLASSSGIGQGQLTADQKRRIAQEKVERNKIIQQGQKRRSADDGIRKEWTKAFNDPTHPMHDKVTWDDSYNFAKFKKDYLAKQSKSDPAKQSKSPATEKKGYIPFKSKFAGARDAAHAKAKNITGDPKKGFGIGGLLKKGAKGALGLLGKGAKNALEYSPLGLAAKVGKQGFDNLTNAASAIGKFSLDRFGQVSKDVKSATPTKKPLSQSDIESQKRLNKLSSKGAGPRTGRGIRYTTEAVKSEKERQSRGGTFGQIGRSFTRIFGSQEAKQKLAAQDKASSSRIKQAGAASIGRYYSSSDGKYYKDYDAAVKAKQARIASAPKPTTPATPAPKVFPARNKPIGTGSTGLSKPVGFKPPAPKPVIARNKPIGTGKSSGLSKPVGGKPSKKEGGGLVDFTNQAKLLRGIKDEPQQEKTFYGMKVFDIQSSFKNYFDNLKSKPKNNTKTAFNRNVNLNSQKPKKQSIADSLKEIRGMRARSLDRQGRDSEALNLRSSLIDTPKFDPNKIKVDPKKPFGKDLGLNIPSIKSDYKFGQVKNNTSLAFNPNTKLNTFQPKKQSIADSLKEIREMRAKSLDRQGEALEATKLRASNYNIPKFDASKVSVDTKKAFTSNLNISTPKISSDVSFKPVTPAPAPAPKPAPKPVGMKGGGLVGGIKNAIGGFFNKNKKRDLVKKGVQKTTAKGDKVKSGFSELTGKRSQKKEGGFWSGVYDKLSGVNTAINTGKELLKSAPKGIVGFGKSAIKKVASNPKLLKAGLAFSKYGGRMLPGVGVATSAAESASRAEQGDKLGAALAGIGAASGATTIATSGASLTGAGAAIPAVAEAVSMVADTALLGKDLFDIAVSPSETSRKNTISKGSTVKTDPKQFVSKKIKVGAKKGGGLIGLEGGGDWQKLTQNYASMFGQQAPDLFSAAPSAPLLPPPPPPPPVFNLPPPPPLPPLPQATSTPATPKAPAKKSIMQQQAEELRAMRANSLERQGRTSEAYGTRAFNTDMSSFFAKGSVMENTGIDMKGGTADRQLTALQPGEYVIPKQTVNAFGGANFFDHMVAKTDSDSNPAKLGAKNQPKVGQNIKPYSLNNSNKKPNITNLGSAKEARSGAQLSQGSTPNGSSKEVFFDALCQDGSAPSERQRIMDLLGVNS